MKLNQKALAWATSVFAGGLWLMLMSLSLLSGIGKETISTWGGFHPWFSYDWTGNLVVTVEHLIFGYLVGWVFAWLYNRFLGGEAPRV